MYYSYVEIEYLATGFSPARTDLALKLLIGAALENFEINESHLNTFSLSLML